MTFETLSVVALVLAAIPAVMFLVNLFVYRPIASKPRTTPANSDSLESLSVLIPARNEEQNIRATLEAVLSNRDAAFEVIVLDDHSTDRTAAIVESFSERDPRVRLESAPPLPEGWCGKQHACAVLARLAKNPLLVFIDADVRLMPGALARMASFMRANQTKPKSQISLASGVPRQELGTFSERLLLPLIHFVLLGYLPMPFMRWTRWAGFSAGCGQLFIARSDAYRATGGHAMIRATLHDGVKLPRLFRRAGFRTDLFDATDVATCRMYQTNIETWRGLGKNATEGLGAPGTILPMSILLFGGQVLPVFLLMMAPFLGPSASVYAGMAAALACLPRLLSVPIYRQPLGSALLHPFGTLALLSIQWWALMRKLIGRPSEWKGRAYPVGRVNRARVVSARTTALLLLLTAMVSPDRVNAAEDVPANDADTNLVCSSFALRDQFGALHQMSFPRTNLLVLTIADRKGNDQIDGWLESLTNRLSCHLAIAGVADVSPVPSLLRGLVQRRFKAARPQPVMLDWHGSVVGKFPVEKDRANIFLIDREGHVVHHASGSASRDSVDDFLARLDHALKSSKP